MKLDGDGKNQNHATALVAAQIDFDMESIMQYEASKKLKTATDDSLAVEHLRGRVFVGNATARDFTTAWSKQDQILVNVKALQDELSSFRKLYDESTSCEEVIRQRFLFEEPHCKRHGIHPQG